MKSPYAAGVFFVALAIRLLHVWQIRRSPFFDVLLGDAHGYDEWARRIAGGEWIGRDVFYQAPLYPYFLGVIYTIFGHSLVAVRVVQAVIGAGSCAFVALAGQRFFSPRIGAVAGFALALYAPAIFFDGLLQKSVLDLFFLALALWLIARLLDETTAIRLWLALGATMGALSLTRENALVFIVVILGWCVFGLGRAVRVRPDTTSVRSRSGRTSRTPPVASSFSPTTAALVFVTGLAIVLLPVALRNYAVGGGFYLTTSQFGPNFYIGNNPNADGTYGSLRFGRGAPEYERQDATELAEHALTRNLTPAEVSTYWTDRALDFITSRPGAWLALMRRKVLLLMNATEMLDTESQESYAEWSWPLRIGAWFGHFGVLMPLAVLGALFAWPYRARVGVLYAMTGFYALSVLLFFVFARYRLPLVPFLILFASVGLAGLRERVRSSNGETIRTVSPAAALIVLVTAVIANWPLLSKTRMQAITETNLATALQAAGRHTEAVAHYQAAIALQPDYAPAFNNLGVALRAAGDVDGAIASYERALAVRGDYPDAHYNLGNALLEKNRPTDAAAHFRIALQSIPDSAGTSNNLGVALAAEGNKDDAIAAFRAAVASEPESAKAHRNLADALSTAGRTAESIAEFERAVQLAPDDADTHYNFGIVLLEAGRLEQAVTEFRAALRIAPQSVDAHNNLGIALGSLGQLDAAIQEFEQALAINPGYAEARRNLEMARTQKQGAGR